MTQRLSSRFILRRRENMFTQNTLHKCSNSVLSMYIHRIGQPLLQLILDYFITLKRNLICFSSHLPLPPIPSPKQPLIYFLSPHLLVLDFSCKCHHKYLTVCDWLRSLGIMPSRLCMLCPESVLHSFLWLTGVRSYGCTIFCLFTHWLVDIWIVSTFWLIWIELLLSVWRVLCEHVFDGSYRNCLTFWGTLARLFLSSCTSVLYEGSNFSTSSPTLVIT